MNRIAIIIGYEGNTRNFLPGVSKDMANYKRFLQSNIGGAWEEDEIISSKSWTTPVLERVIDNLKANGIEYFLIIFSGHGYAIKGVDTYLEFQNNDDLALGTLQRWLQFNKSLIIADSCRKFIEIIEKAQASAQIRLFSDSHAVPRYKYRELYNKGIEGLERYHNTFVASAALNECAEDTDQGGLFSKTLLDLASDIGNWSTTGIYTIKALHPSVAEKVHVVSQGNQNPQIYPSSETLSPPFVVKPSLY